MKISRLVLLSLCCARCRLALAGCGGGDDDVPADAVAVVDGEEIASSDYDALLAQAKKSYANQKREFPKAGSQEFQTLQNQAVQFLVQREQFEQEAEDLDVEVTDKAGRRPARADPEAVLRRRQEEVREAAEGAGAHRGAGAQRHPRADHLGEDLRGGHRRREGDRQADRGVLREEQGAVQPAGEP